LKYHYQHRQTRSFKKLKLLSAAGVALVIGAYSLNSTHVLGHMSGHPWFGGSKKAQEARLTAHSARHARKIAQKNHQTKVSNTTPAASTTTPINTTTPGQTAGNSGGTALSPVAGGTTSPIEAILTGANPTAGGTVIRTVYTTAYTYFDNTPAGSATIAFPRSSNSSTLHDVAGGSGTYADPVTLAVGHVITGGKSVADFAPGTRFYFPDIRKYAIVEDLCGDGGAPQNIPCHNVSTAASGTTLWLDLWIGGSAGDNRTAVQNCAGIVTDSTGALHTVVKDPSPNYLVVPGPVYQNGYCIQPGNKGFGNTLLTQ
jgi:hypothetical protein